MTGIMLFDAMKKFLGLGDFGDQRQPRLENEPLQPPSTDIDERLVPHRQPMYPDINQMDSEIDQLHKCMEDQMRSMISSFGFTFGDSAFRAFPFPSLPDFPHSPNISIDPDPNSPTTPRDEVLKPQYRSNSAAPWNGQDQILDERVNSEGLGPVIQELNPPNDESSSRNPFMDSFSHMFGSGFFGNGLFGSTSELNSFSSSSSVTIYTNVNGRTSLEKVIRHPDGTVERTVITKDDAH